MKLRIRKSHKHADAYEIIAEFSFIIVKMTSA